MNQCSFDECGRAEHAKGLCMGHYDQQRKGKTLAPLREYKRRPPAPEGFLYCNKCEAFKKEDEFYNYPNGKPHPKCKVCHKRESNDNYKRKRAAA